MYFLLVRIVRSPRCTKGNSKKCVKSMFCTQETGHRFLEICFVYKKLATGSLKSIQSTRKWALVPCNLLFFFHMKLTQISWVFLKDFFFLRYYCGKDITLDRYHNQQICIALLKDNITKRHCIAVGITIIQPKHYKHITL